MGQALVWPGLILFFFFLVFILFLFNNNALFDMLFLKNKFWVYVLIRL
jgi:hypothetical protein